jgi:hypothetical protein
MWNHIKLSYTESKDNFRSIYGNFKLNTFGKIILFIPCVMAILVGFVIELGMDHEGK